MQKFGTQKDFVIIIRSNPPVVSRVVRGLKELPPEQKEKWARVLGCKVDELFKD